MMTAITITLGVGQQVEPGTHPLGLDFPAVLLSSPDGAMRPLATRITLMRCSICCALTDVGDGVEHERWHKS